jgi:hypothetical protein
LTQAEATSNTAMIARIREKLGSSSTISSASISR